MHIGELFVACGIQIGVRMSHKRDCRRVHSSVTIFKMKEIINQEEGGREDRERKG